MKKRFLAGILAMVMAVATLTGCGATKEDQLAKIQKDGKIIIAMEGQWAPWTYHDETGELVGFDTEVGKAIAGKLGVDAEFVEGEWDGLFTGLDSGKYDVIINGVEITEAREEKYDFTTAYAFDHTVLIVPEDNDSITTFADLNGLTTTNSLGSTYADLAEQNGATVQNVDTLSETIDMIVSGRADATLNAESSFYDYMAEKPDTAIKIVATYDEAARIAIPTRKGDESKALREAIDKAISELKADGTLEALSQKYFGRDITNEK